MTMGSGRAYFLLISSIILTVLTAFLIYVSSEKKAQNSSLLIETHNVIDSAKELLANLRDAEAYQRGYLLTGNAGYLEPFHVSMTEINESLKQLEGNSINSPKQQQIIIQQLYPLIESKKNELELSIVRFQHAGPNAGLDVVKSDLALNTMNHIRKALTEFINVETATFISRERQLKNSMDITNIVSFTGLLFILFTIFFALFTLYSKDRQNRKLIEQLEENNQELMQMHDKQQELYNNLRKFMGIASHDLRSPLNAITTLTSLLKQDSDSFTQEQMEYIQYILDSARQMSRLISDLLDIHRMDEEKAIIQNEEVDIHSLLKALFFSFEGWARQKHIELELESDFIEKNVITDKSIFTQIADNLISNAIKFSYPNTVVNVRLKENDGSFLLIVQDQGPGIKKSEMKHLYKRYQTLSNHPTGGEKSIGLGLSIVKDRIELIKGNIRCDSEYGVGTIFTATFPEETCVKQPTLPTFRRLKKVVS